MSEEIRELKEKAQALLAKRQHRKALAIFDQALELDPNDAFVAKKTAEMLDALGEKEEAAKRYVRLSALLEKSGRRLQAIACCKLALGSFPSDAAAKSLLETLYQGDDSQHATFSLNQQALTRAPVKPPHPGSGVSAQSPMIASTAGVEPTHAEGLSAEAGQQDTIAPAVVRHVETFVSALSGLCATFSGVILAAEKQSLTDSIAGNTDFLWVIQFSGAAVHTVVVAAQRRFILGLTKRVLDVDEGTITEGMASKLSNKLIGMYVDDVKRAFATQGEVVSSGPPLPITGANAMYQLEGARVLHVPMSSEIGWVQLTVTGGV